MSDKTTARTAPSRGGTGARGGSGTGAFEAERRRLTGLAYRVTGSAADAEDVVQEAWVRWQAAPPESIANPAAWLTTVTARVALDRLRAQRRRREVYVGPWLPDPVATLASPEQAVELAESLTVGFLVVLDRLGPAERVAFLLADIFGESYGTVAEALGKTEDACRQLVSRARRKVRAARGEPGAPQPRAAPARLLEELIAAVLAGDEEGALSLLDPDVVFVSDAGALRRAARHPVVGARRVLQLISGGWRLFGFESRPSAEEMPAPRAVTVNSTASFVFDLPGGPVVISAEATEGRISTIWARLNPEKTTALNGGTELL